MDAIDLHIHATVGFALSTGYAAAAMEIGLYGDQLAYLEAISRQHMQHFCGEFVTEDAGVVEIGLYALECMEVGAANTNLTDL
ncbi:hypothetical protein GCM10007415_23270 [Parapedobacter pyrenivorans]|uniref:Uncharacterized protein n=1 Tax=Parapedobacter pyrenivorans TaxID=1305674 RepID=A0A917MCH6_9SPHI|nr:hypothetical protein GCM10007415_23270 [Parapedobacter pyrenivorans]